MKKNLVSIILLSIVISLFANVATSQAAPVSNPQISSNNISDILFEDMTYSPENTQNTLNPHIFFDRQSDKQSINYNSSNVKNQEKYSPIPIKILKVTTDKIEINRTNDYHIYKEFEEKNYSNINARLNHINAMITNPYKNNEQQRIEEYMIDKYSHIPIAKTALDALGMPYKYADDGKEGFDCSGLISYIYGKYDIDLPRSTYDMVKRGREVSLEDIRLGDLVFFDTTSSFNSDGEGSDESISYSDDDKEQNKRVSSHVGMYIGDGLFIHSSSGVMQKVVLDKITNDYYYPRITTVRRYIENIENL